MNERSEKVQSRVNIEQAAIRTKAESDPAFPSEASEIKGWALQWDTTELRKANLARKMRHLRQSSSDQ